MSSYRCLYPALDFSAFHMIYLLVGDKGVHKCMANAISRIFHMLTSEDIDDVIYRFLH